MALTASNPFPAGTIAPDFKLLDTISNEFKSLKDLKGTNGTAVFFICNHCPFVIHVNEELIRLANDYNSKSIGFIAISSNNIIAYPQDGPDKMKETAINLGFPFPYLFDATQEVARAYDATCTPDLYLFDSELKAVYHGQLDDSRPGNGIPVTGSDFRNAIDCLIEGIDNPSLQKPSIGCGIKWV